MLVLWRQHLRNTTLNPVKRCRNLASFYRFARQLLIKGWLHLCLSVSCIGTVMLMSQEEPYQTLGWDFANNGTFFLSFYWYCHCWQLRGSFVIRTKVWKNRRVSDFRARDSKSSLMTWLWQYQPFLGGVRPVFSPFSADSPFDRLLLHYNFTCRRPEGSTKSNPWEGNVGK